MKSYYYLILLILFFSCSSSEKSNNELDLEVINAIEELEGTYEDLFKNMEFASLDMVKAHQSVQNLNLQDNSGLNVFYRYSINEVSYNSIRNLNEIVRVVNLLESRFTLSFVKFSRLKTSDQEVKSFCILSIQRFLNQLEQNLINLDKFILLSGKVKFVSKSDNEILNKFLAAKTTLELILKESSLDESNLKDVLGDQEKANLHIKKIEESLDTYIIKLKKELDELVNEISES